MSESGRLERRYLAGPGVIAIALFGRQKRSGTGATVANPEFLSMGRRTMGSMTADHSRTADKRIGQVLGAGETPTWRSPLETSLF